MFSKKHYFILIFFWINILFPLLALTKQSLWVTPWDLTSKEKIDKLILDCKEWRINEILAEVRYRGDALYVPNKYNRRFPNPEPRSYILDNPDFDPLDYLIYQAKANHISVQAWVTALVVTPLSTEKLSRDHVFFQHPEWITRKADQTVMSTSTLEGAYLDPAIPEVRDYLANVFADIASNYEIDGIQLDYIRYPDTGFGYHPLSVSGFNQQNQLSWEQWKEKQITETVKTIRHRIQSVKPEMILSCAVKPNPVSAIRYFGQNWVQWLQSDLIDEAYLMAYYTKNSDFSSCLNKQDASLKDKTIIGLKAYEDVGDYPESLLSDKIRLSLDYGFKGVSFFSYAGINQSSYQKALKSVLPQTESKSAVYASGDCIEGKVYDCTGKTISGAKIRLLDTEKVTYSDQTGYFVFYNIPRGNYTLEAVYQKFKTTQTAKIKNHFYKKSLNEITFNEASAEEMNIAFRGFSDNRFIYLLWQPGFNAKYALYRKKIYSPDNTPDSLYELISMISSGKDFYTDNSALPLCVYEYKLVNTATQNSTVFRLELDFTQHPLEFNAVKTGEWNFNLTVQNPMEIKWALLKPDETLLAYGVNALNPGINHIVWNGLNPTGERANTHLMIFEYQISGQKKWFRKYCLYE